MRDHERRNRDRKAADLPVYKTVGGSSVCCRIDDVSPSGVRLARRPGDAPDDACDLELHLVPDKLTTVFNGRLVWRDDAHEAFEFVAPRRSQQAVLEKVLRSY